MTEVAAEKVDTSFHHQQGEYDYTEEDYLEAVKVELPVVVAKIDCVVHHSLCVDENIMGYPTLRLFVDGQRFADYYGDRTVLEMVHWLSAAEEYHKKEVGEELALPDVDTSKFDI